MDDKEAPPIKPALSAIALDWLRVSLRHLLRLGKFFTWLKQPSNLLSLAAIVAVIVVPWIEKIVKSDEELRAKINSLLEATNKVIATNQQRMSPSGSDILGNAVLTAQRENELVKASAIAKSIEHNVYPTVLFALSNELCASGRFEEAHGYLREVLKRGTGIHFLATRPSNREVAQAHVVSARCYADESQVGGKVSDQGKKSVNDEMTAAVAALEHGDSDRALGELAIVYVEWADLDQRIGEPVREQSHRQKASEIAKKMHFVDPTLAMILGPRVSADPPPAPTIKESNLPRSSEGDTYVVSFPDDPDWRGLLYFEFLPFRGDMNPQAPSISIAAVSSSKRMTSMHGASKARPS